MDQLFSPLARNLRFYTLLFMMLFMACSDENNEPEQVNEFLVDYFLKSEYNQESIRSIATFSGLSTLTDAIQSDVSVYVIQYKTVVDGEEVIASGIASFPNQIQGPVPMISAHRGTIFEDTEAPSTSIFPYGFELFATAGYVVVLSDMIGFGSTKDLVQHYYNKETNSRVAIDMIKAGGEFFKEIGATYTDQLFLTGYSQGGFITMATLEAIEQDPSLPWNVVAAATGAGSYNIEFVMDDVLDRGVFTSPGFLSLIVYSYNEVNNFNKPMEYYFQQPFANKIPGLLDGSSSWGTIRQALSDTIDHYFQHSFLEGLRNRTETEILNAFQQNSVHNWVPNVPVRFYHSSGDEFIPIEDSQNTVELMASKGADVSFYQIGDQDHGTALLEMLVEVLPWFEELKDGS